MMRCPACGERINVSFEKEQLRCPTCGWGTGQPVSVPKRIRTRRRAVRATNPTNVVLLWLVAAGITAIAAWIVFGLVRIRATDEHILIFAGCLVGYGVLGYFIQPAADEEGADWLFDGCWSDQEEGGELLLLSVLLFPGRLIALTFLHTFRLILQTFKPSDSSGGVTR